MLSTYNHAKKKISHRSVLACLVPICSLHGVAVTTVEGVGSTRDGLHPVQERLADSHGTQCGFCSPGMVMSMYTLLHNNPHPTQHDIEVALEGNLCRCTGYRPILDAFKPFAKCELGEKCCRNQKCAQENQTIPGMSNYLPEHPTQSAIFPSELQLNPEYTSTAMVFNGPRVSWYRPTSLNCLLELKTQHPKAKLVAGFTSLGSSIKYGAVYQTLICTSLISDLQEVMVTEEGVHFGAALTFTEFKEVMEKIIKEKSATETEVFVSLLEALRWFTSSQIRNVATLGGNIVSGISESFIPLLIAAESVVTVVSEVSEPRKVTLDASFYIDSYKTILKPEEVIQSIFIPFSKQNEYFCEFHHSGRRAFSQYILNAGMKVSFEEKSHIVKTINICFGGIRKKLFVPTTLLQKLIGREWNQRIIEEGCQLLSEGLSLNVLESKELFRLNLAHAFFLRFVLKVAGKLKNEQPQLESALFGINCEAGEPISRGTSHGTQVYEQVAPGQPLHDAVGRPLPHASAKEHVTGEAQYVDDIPVYKGELHAAPVLSTKAHAKIKNVDVLEALSLPGVVDFINYKDVPGTNKVGSIIPDDEVFASEKVVCQGQVIGLILADSSVLARRAAKLVQVTYEELKPILTIEQAIVADSFHWHSKPAYVTKDVDSKLAESPHVIEEELYIGSQEHMYLEPHASLVVPKVEHGEMEIYSTTHSPLLWQEHSAQVLGLQNHKVYLRVKRLGGGFGGKECRAVVALLPAVVAAHKTKRPVRYTLERDEDMIMTGGRNPMLAKYKIGFDDSGKVQAVYVDLYSDGGCTWDNSPGVLSVASSYLQNVFKFPSIDVNMHVCHTNLPSNTSFRGFGQPQASFFINSWMNEIAEHLKMQSEQVMELNLMKDGDLTPDNQVHTENLMRCWREVLESSDYYKRQENIKKFNNKNKYKKKGMAIVPTAFGISFPPPAVFLNSGGALVHIYKDGSVLVSHGGVEMGQGLHTKIIQVASRALGVPVDVIHIAETSTFTVPNSIPTAASLSTDVFGMAVLNACETLMERLKPFMEANPGASWNDWVKAAYFNRVNLSSTGFYKVPGLNYDPETNKGNLYAYYTYGAGVSEVEIDCLTGDHVLHRTDIVMDVGTSLNPAIDIGQIEGAFMQGYGLHTMEERIFSDTGAMLSDSPRSYMIPTFNDIPVEFNVSLLKESKNLKAVYSSKGIGEPPLLLAPSAFLAIRAAIKASREDVGLEEKFRLDSPATSQKIQALCGQILTKKT